MKLYSYHLILTLSLSTLSQTSHAVLLTGEESQAFKVAVLRDYQAPQEIHATLAPLLEQDLFRTYMAGPKRVQLAGTAGGRLTAAVQFGIKAAIQEREQLVTRSQRGQASLRDNFATFCTQNNLRNIALEANTAAVTSDDWSFVIRIPLCEWYDTFVHDATKRTVISPIPMKPSKYQNISRVFYAKEINDFIEKEGFKHIRPLKQWLMHIPGQPTELSDENYVVVAEKIPDLPEVVINQALFATLDHSNFTLAMEFAEAIYEANLWDVSARNVFIVEGKILFLDTEKPGLSSGADANFFHTHEGEVVSNTRTGFEGASKLVNPAGMPRKVIDFVKERRDARLAVEKAQQDERRAMMNQFKADMPK